MPETNTNRNRWVLVVVGAAVVIGLFQFTFVRKAAATTYESTMMTVSPSAERAYVYGTHHFDARNPEYYDLDRAERYYERANELNASLPYLQHQRARIAFLKGNFPDALALIDTELSHNPQSTSSYYVRGLINGFAGDYDGAAADYEAYLRSDPKNWAGINDYAWVLLKAERPLDALVALDWGLIYWPDNPWLLNSKATAHFELDELVKADEAAHRANDAVAGVTEEEWLRAYPGNDPLIAKQGVEAFQKAVAENMHTISLALNSMDEDVQ